MPLWQAGIAPSSRLCKLTAGGYSVCMLDSITIPRLSLNTHDVQQLDILTDHISTELPAMTEPEFFDAIDECAPNAQDVIPEVTEKLRSVASHLGPKALILELPPETVANVGATPAYHRDSAEQQLYPSDIYRALMISLAGLYAFGNKSFHGGAIHHDIIYAADAKNSSAKNEEMRLHVSGLYFNRNPAHYPEPDTPNLNLSADFLTLHFQRNEEKVPTVLVFPAWEQLSERTRSTLSQPCLYLNKSLPPLSVLYGDNPDNPWVRYVTDEEYIENAKNETARSAFRELNQHLLNRQVTVPMEAGQILFFDNRRLLHGRTARSQQNLPPPDRWRWQRRVHCVTDPERIRQPGLPARMVETDRVYVYGRR